MLTYLDLRKNEIQKIPSNSFKSLVNLQSLDLSSNKIKGFSGLATLFASLERLTKLSLRENELSKLPNSLFGKLKVFWNFAWMKTN